MAYIDWNLIPGLENEYTEINDIVDIDVEELSAEIEKSQEIIVMETENYNSGLESLYGLQSLSDSIAAGLESNLDIVSTRLLLNTLDKEYTKLYGTKISFAGMESDSPVSLLEAGLEESKGMINSVKEFIAKVWQKIKDAFSFVWKKMKEFWAWLTGASKKVEEKLEETIVVAAAVQAVETKAKDIEKAKEDIKSGKNIDAALRRARKRQDIRKASRTSTDTDITFLIIDGKFKGKVATDLSQDEFNEWMSGDKANEEIIIDAVVEDIIIEEVVKVTGLTEEKVMIAAPTSIMKELTVYAYDPALLNRITIIIKKNFDNNIEKLTSTMLLTTVLQLGADSFVQNFPYKIVDPFDAYSSFASSGAKLDELKQKIIKKLSQKSTQEFAITANIGDYMFSGNMSDWVESISLSSSNAISFINNMANSLEPSVFDSLDRDKTFYEKTFSALTPINVSGNVVTFINAFEKGTFELNNIAAVTTDKINSKFIEAVSGISIGKSVGWVNRTPMGYLGGDIDDVQGRIEHLIKFADEALTRVSKAGEKYMDGAGGGQYKNNKDWLSMQLTFTRLIANVSSFNPMAIMTAGRASLASLESVLTIMDMPGAIAQATKELGK